MRHSAWSPPRSGVSPARIRWAPRIDPRRLRRLYAAEARGLATAALIDDVGVALLLRCESILLVSAGGVRCPVCEPVRRTEFALRQPAAGTLPQEPQRCRQPGCGWSITWQQYHASWTKGRLFGGKVVAAFRTFAVAYPRAAEPRRKLLLIDQLLHAFHWDLEVGAPNRLAANNLIEGSHGQVLALLEELSGHQPPEERDRWRDDVARMVQRRRPRREPGMEPEPGAGHLTVEPPAEHGNLAENTALIRNLEHAGVRARVAPDLQGSPAWRAACDCWRNGRRPVAPCQPAYPGTESGIASTFGPPPRSASCGWPTATAPTSLPSTPANWPRRPQWKQGLEHLPGAGAVLRELLATLGRDAWLYLSDRAVHGCLQLLELLHSRGALEITHILLRDVGSGDPVYRGPAKFDGSVVEWFNGALFQEFARRAFPDCHFDIQSLAEAGKRHMTRLEVRRG